MILLESLQQDVSVAMERLTHDDRKPSASPPAGRPSTSTPEHGPTEAEDNPPEVKNLESIIESPLAVLVSRDCQEKQFSVMD